MSGAAIALGVILTLVLGGIAGSGFMEPHVMAIAVLAVGATYFVGRGIAVDEDRKWLPTLLVSGMLAKLAGSWARYFVLFTVYDGSGDAKGYHGTGAEVAAIWRTLSVPDIASSGTGGAGTRFVKWLTGLIYTPFEPSILGGFLIFAALGFIGQVFFYAALRKSAPSSTWKRYALLLFFWPTLVYWPASIGKEALMMLFLGIGAWAAASIYRRFDLRWLLPIAAMAFLVGMVRIHLAAIFAGSALAGAILAKAVPESDVRFRRTILVVVGVAAMIPLGLAVSEKFGVSLDQSFSVEELDPVIDEVADQTGQGGSAVSGGIIRSPADIPAGVLKVLFRPLPNEAGNVQTLAASIEGAMLLLLVVWRLPAMIGNVALVRRSSYLMFCFVYTSVFVWAWSAILNLGILARQRSLVLPAVLALVASLGWPREEVGSEQPQVDAGELGHSQPSVTSRT